MVPSARRIDLQMLFPKVVLPGLLIVLSGCGGGESAAPAAADSSVTPAEPAEAVASGSSPAPTAAMGMAPPGASDSSGGASSAPGASGMPGGYSGGMPAGYSGGMPAGYNGGMAASSGPGAGMMSGSGSAPGSSYPGGINPSGTPVAAARPGNFATWTDKNFLDAARERDPKLLAAIDSKVLSAPGDPKVAELLASILVASVEKPAANSNASGAPGSGMPSGYPGMQPGAPGMANPSGDAEMSSGDSGGPRFKGLAPAGMAPSGGTADGPQGLAPPQSRLETMPGNLLAVDSISMMIAESATSYMQGPAVGAVAGRAGSMVPGQDSLSPPGEDAATSSGGDPEMEPGSASNGAPGAPGGSYPGGSYPGGAYPGMQPGGMGSGGSQTANGGLENRKLVEHVVDGLVKNGTPKAWQTVYGIAAGTVKTPVDLTNASEIVVLSLFRNLDKNQATIEQILLSLIDGTAAVPPESRASCLRAMSTISATAMDKLTGFKAMAATGSPGGMGGSGMPGGMGMGMGGPGMSGPGMSGPGMSGPGMSGPGMSGPGGSGLAGYPGSTPPAGGPPAASGKADEGLLPAAALMNAAGFLWNAKAVAAISKQLETAVDPISAADILTLSATIPNRDIRRAELAAFTRLHTIGVDGLSASGFFRSSVRDPGMQVVLKSLPRQKPPRDAAQAAPMDSWMMASQDLAISLRDQLRALSSQPGKLLPAGDAFPVRLHKNAVSQFSGMIKLPGTAGEKLKDAAPAETTIYYARTSFSPQRAKEQEDITEHYESRASGVRRADPARGVLWIDGVKANQNGTKRSTDVIIQAATAGGGGPAGFGGSSELGPGGPGGSGGPGGAGGSFSIEIIVVEISDPKSVVATTSQASAKP